MNVPGRQRSASARLPSRSKSISSEVRGLIDNLNALSPGSSTSRLRAHTVTSNVEPPKPTSIQVLRKRCDTLRQLRQHIVESSDRRIARDTFRHCYGFEALIEGLRSVSGFFGTTRLSAEDRKEFFELVNATFDVISEAFYEHHGNRRYFAKRLDGWNALEQALASTGIVGGHGEDTSGYEQLFGCLLAFGIVEDSTRGVFRDISKVSGSPDDSVRSSASNGHNGSNGQQHAAEDRLHVTGALRARISRFLNGSELLQNSEIVGTIISFWSTLYKSDNSRPLQTLLDAVLLVLDQLMSSSVYNKSAISNSGILDVLLPLLFSPSSQPATPVILRSLAGSLAEYGFNRVDTAYFLYQRAVESENAASFLLQIMKASKIPPFVQFDLSLHGYSSIELRSLGRPFPPSGQSAGYTISTWIRIDQFDKTCHTNIFGAFDASQTCFVLAYLEKESHHMILQTSIESSRPSVRFRTTVFKESVWYHVALVHRRPVGKSQSRASLFINGEFVEQAKLPYPAKPPLPDGSVEGFAAVPIHPAQPTPVQAFLGTPQDLADRLGRNVVSTRWSLASFHLFQEALSDELIAVHQKLGPRYNGNFQDHLGNFQTYRASAELHLRNEYLHPSGGKGDSSEITAAIRGRAGNLLPEYQILLSISPTAILDDNDQNNINESQLIKSLSKESAKRLYDLTHVRGNAIAVNAAVPSINEALTVPNGIALLAGEPVVVVPQPLDEMSYQLAGCVPICLRLIELAATKDAVIRAVEILFEAVNDSWRNSEAMERDNGYAYAILAVLIRDKLGLDSVYGGFAGPSTRPKTAPVPFDQREELASRLLDIILNFVGYDKKDPINSIIINPLAYRVLLADFDTWRVASVEVQKTYYRQFIDFSKDSKHHNFNIRRLTRMRLIKKFIEALKDETFLEEVFTDFLDAFKTLFMCNVSPDNLRYISLFITYALQEGRIIPSRPLRGVSGAFGRHSSAARGYASGTSSPHPGSHGTSTPIARTQLSRAEIGVRMLEMYTGILCEPARVADADRFSRAVHNKARSHIPNIFFKLTDHKWLLFLLSESDVRVIILSLRILARLLILNGSEYIRKFADKSGGFVVFEGRLKSWWHVPAVWSICFGILLGYEVPVHELQVDGGFPVLCLDHFDERRGILCPLMLSVLFVMLETGIKAVTSQVPPEENILQPTKRQDSLPIPGSGKKPGSPRLSQFPRLEIDLHGTGAISCLEELEERNTLLQAVIMCFGQLHSQSQVFRDFELNSNFVQKLLFALYPVAVTSDVVSVETELHSRGSALSFEGQGAAIRPRSRSPSQAPPVVRRARADSEASNSSRNRVAILRRGSSFVLLPADQAELRAAARLSSSLFSSRNAAKMSLKTEHPLVEALVNTIVNIYMDQIFQRKEFPGFGLFLRVPPGFQEHQAYFETYILLHAMTEISKSIERDQRQLHEPKLLTNLARYVQHMAEAVFEGWFIDGAEPLLDFIGKILEYVQRPDIAQVKGVRLCTQAIASIRIVFLRVTLLRLSEVDEATDVEDKTALLHKLTYWQTVILSPDNSEEQYLRLICYLLYNSLTSIERNVRLAAANFWRMMLVQKPSEAEMIFQPAATNAQRRRLATGLMKILELEDDAFLDWIDNNREDLDSMFKGTMAKAWDDFVNDENRRTAETGRNRINKRRERLKQWQAEENSFDGTWNRHEIGTSHWNANVYAAERTRHLRSIQDYQATLSDIAVSFEKYRRVLQAPLNFPSKDSEVQWQLDETEGRNRMRSRLIIYRQTKQTEYQPKRKVSGMTPQTKLKLDTNVKRILPNDSIAATPVDGTAENSLTPGRQRSSSQSTDFSVNVEEEYEIVADPNDDGEGYEDKNRRVLRSLQKNDQVKHVYNISRIVALGPVEGLLIVGRDSLYMLDGLFARADGEIVSIWQAPIEERDPYIQMLDEGDDKDKESSGKMKTYTGDRTTRHWHWVEVISISRRRFLLRDVAIEIFFSDGRSYLLTAKTTKSRDELFSKIMNRSPTVNNPISLDPETAWRLESLRNPDDAPQTLGSKFASVFNSTSWNPATRKWLKGDISNFQYLMLVNTMAGRTFNDLTQYPVFPWVLADYTSDELDLNDPKTFRDFTKPIGAQHRATETMLRERYNQLVEMGGMNGEGPYHYGSHYSSAAAVTSFLIRLEPFAGNFITIQGGRFDHADRTFYSIERTWHSATTDPTRDVRELIPEFFFLPEFLMNLNGYDFGYRYTGQKVEDVELPPWAKGDPYVFIAKHREALESPYVSRNLHHWIDLIFGHKARGEAAFEATNVFHPVTYAETLESDKKFDKDKEDVVKMRGQVQRIQHFGQTPHQVFARPHVQRESKALKHTGLDTTAEGLTRVPYPILETNERVSSMLYHKDKLLCSAAFRVNIPPLAEKYMEWGFADNSIRFYEHPSRKMIGHFEHVHQGQISCAVFADSKTLVLAGTDCTITIWNVVVHSKSVDLVTENRVSLFGHKAPVAVLAPSRTFSTLLSASTDGKVYLWDLNRSEFVRELGDGRYPVQYARINNVTGQIVLCSAGRIFVYSLNGHLLLSQKICDYDDADDIVHSVAWYEGVGNEWLQRNLLFTGHRRGVTNVWNIVLDKQSKWKAELVHRLNNIDAMRVEGGNYSAAITCILPVPQAQVVYTGDEDGRVYEWDCVKRG